MQVLSHAPRVSVLDKFMSAVECRAIRALVRPRLGECLIEAGHPDPIRTSAGAWLPRSDLASAFASPDSLELLRTVEHRIALASGLPFLNQEPGQVLRYRRGQQYEEHPDFFDCEWQQDELANGGNRAATFLVYLSDVPAINGGATVFPRAKDGPLRIQPAEGRAVMWHNLLPRRGRRSGRVDLLSVHASEPMIGTAVNCDAAPDGDGDEKWVLSKWLREGEFSVDVDAFMKDEPL